MSNLNYKNTINDNNLNVNGFDEIYQDFLDMVSSDKENKKYVPLFRLVPEIHKNYVASIIKNQFGGSEEEYIKTIPLFFECFSEKDKEICDDVIYSNNKQERRNLKKKKKHLILYSAQLLKLMGLKRSSIITNDCVAFYRDEMQKTDDFLAQHRLVAADGTITRLTSNESKQKQKVAQILKISECMSLKAKDEKFSFMLLTLTLPPCFHCNPYSNKQSFSGYTPGQALATINRYWKAIRAKLQYEGFKVGDDYFGIQVLELQGGSTLHLHCLLYSREEHQDDIQAAIQRVRVLENSQYQDKANDSEEKRAYNKAHRVECWDVSTKDDTKVTDSTNAGARYVFKYIMKTHTNYKSEHADDSALKNLAARFFYGCRGFNFFGMKGSITKFNYLQRNFSRYEDVLDDDLCRVLRQGDYYDFLHNYEQYFSNAYTKDRRFIGVSFDKSKFEQENNLIARSIMNNEIVMIEKRQYCVFEKLYDVEIKSVRKADFEKLEYANLKHAYDCAQLKQQSYELDFKKYIEESKVTLSKSEKLTKSEAMRLYNFQTTDFVCDYEFLDIDLGSHGDIIQLIYAIQEKRSPTDKIASEVEQHDYCDS